MRKAGNTMNGVIKAKTTAPLMTVPVDSLWKDSIRNKTSARTNEPKLGKFLNFRRCY